MQQAISTQKTHTNIHDSYANAASATAGLIHRFIAWCNIQEENRFLWLAIAFVGGIATILPLTLIAVVFGADNNFNLWILACIINVPILIVNLAQQPTKIILPVLFLGMIGDAMIILYCLALFFVK